MEAVERLCAVCEESGISHVHIEAGRLLSVVVKYCQDRGKPYIAIPWQHYDPTLMQMYC